VDSKEIRQSCAELHADTCKRQTKQRRVTTTPRPFASNTHVTWMALLAKCEPREIEANENIRKLQRTTPSQRIITAYIREQKSDSMNYDPKTPDADHAHSTPLSIPTTLPASKLTAHYPNTTLSLTLPWVIVRHCIDHRCVFGPGTGVRTWMGASEDVTGITDQAEDRKCVLRNECRARAARRPTLHSTNA
jgi:hypothetical protein